MEPVSTHVIAAPKLGLLIVPKLSETL